MTRSRPSVLATLLLSGLSVLIMIWPAIFNRGAILFYDTTAYFSGPARALETLFGVHTDWLRDAGNAVDPISGAPVAMPGDAGQAQQVNAGRSIYYGVLVLVPELIGGLWLSVLTQAAIMVWALALLLRTLGATRAWLLLALCGFLALLSSVAFFNSSIMPDFLAGIAIVATAICLTFGEAMTRAVLLQWFVLLALALSAHSSHILITVLIAVAGLLLTRIANGRVNWRGVRPVAIALILAGLLQVAFLVGVHQIYGRDAANPPFITVRLAAARPGYDYLRATCPGNGLRLCDFLDRLPEDSDEFLWSRDPGRAVFRTASPQVRRDLLDEQMTFAWNVLRYDFTGQLAASLRDFVEQLGRFDLSEFAYTADMRSYFANTLPPEVIGPVQRERLYEGRFPLSAISRVLAINLAISTVVVLIFAVRSGARVRHAAVRARGFWTFVMLLVIGVVANAAVTGMLSAPHDRYQARVIWLIPAAMFLIVAVKKRLLLPDMAASDGHANGRSKL